MSEQEAVQEIVIGQLLLEHTITLHSKTAAKNGGDYDFDVVCVVEEQRFPRWVEDLKWTPLSRPFFARNKLIFGGVCLVV